MKQYEKFLMQQNEVYTLYKNYTSDIMQALKEKIDENNKLKENINIKETYKCYSDYAVMYNKGINKYINDKGKILPRRATGACSKHQRDITIAVKRARQIAILPYTQE